MQTIIGILEAVGVFLAGVLARFGIVVVMIAVVALPALVLALAAHWLSLRHQRALGLHAVRGLVVRSGARYAPGHTWLAARKSGSLEIGIDDLAQRILPSVTAVELPRAGTTLKKGEVVATLHGGGRAVPIAAPVNGTVVGVNASVVREFPGGLGAMTAARERGCQRGLLAERLSSTVPAGAIEHAGSPGPSPSSPRRAAGVHPAHRAAAGAAERRGAERHLRGRRGAPRRRLPARRAERALRRAGEREDGGGARAPRLAGRGGPLRLGGWPGRALPTGGGGAGGGSRAPAHRAARGGSPFDSGPGR